MFVKFRVEVEKRTFTVATPKRMFVFQLFTQLQNFTRTNVPREVQYSIVQFDASISCHATEAE
jgi:hypothetical protein